MEEETDGVPAYPGSVHLDYGVITEFAGCSLSLKIIFRTAVRRKSNVKWIS